MTAQVTIILYRCLFIPTTVYKSSRNFTLLNLRLDLGLVFSFCVTAQVTIILYRNFNSCIPGGPAAPWILCDGLNRPSRCHWNGSVPAATPRDFTVTLNLDDAALSTCNKDISSHL